MDDLSEKINSVLNDPEQMKGIMDMAKSFMGSSDDNGTPSASNTLGLPLDPSLIGKLGALLGSTQNDEKKAMLEAMKPYLSEKRRMKMDKAMKLAKLAALARIAVSDLKEDKDVQSL